MEQFSFLDALNALDTVNELQKPQINQISSVSAQQLIMSLKAAAVNFRTLHRNLVGGNWFEIHELLGEYYNKIDEFEDSIVENLISLGIADIKLDGSTIIDPKAFDEAEALHIVKDTLDNIKLLSGNTRKEISIPTSIAPAFDELENWIQIESDYKLKHYFKENN